MGDDDAGITSVPKLLSVPWRTFNEKDSWSTEVWQSLKDEIVTHNLLKEANIEYFNVLLLGQIREASKNNTAKYFLIREQQISKFYDRLMGLTGKWLPFFISLLLNTT